MSSEHVEAVKWYERLLERYPASEIASEALLQAAASYARIGKPKAAVSRYQNFIDKYPDDPKLNRAYLNLVDLYRDLGEDHEALKWCELTEKAFTGKAPEAVAIFASARIKLARGEWKDALDLVERLGNHSQLGGMTIPGGTFKPEVDFLKGYALENLKRYKEAIDVYLSISDARGEYYGWLANKRLTDLREAEPAGSIIARNVIDLSIGLRGKHAETRKFNAHKILRLTNSQALRDEAAKVLNDALESQKLQTKEIGKPEGFSGRDGVYSIPKRPGLDTSLFNTLADLGLHDDAAIVLDSITDGKLPSSELEANLIGEAFVRGDRGDLALSAIDGLTRKRASNDSSNQISKRQLRLLYPVVYRSPLLRESQANGVDPRLILAITKQESGFQAAAHSAASARGLMQFIPSTAGRVSANLGRIRFDEDELYSPLIAIKFGAHYLGELFKSFPDKPEAVVASYNGGDENMSRWLARSRSSSPEGYVPEIMFTQTKTYVYRVMSNYRVYQSLYNEDLSKK